MERNGNSESPPEGNARPGWNRWEEWDGQDSSIPEEPCEPADDGLPSPHLEPGEQTWVEAELERRGRGEPPKHSLPGEPKLPHEVYAPPPPRRTGSGFFYRNGDEIPPTHPDHGPMHLIPRQQDGSFASYYYCSKVELAAMGSPAPPPRRHRRDGFSPERQQRFVEAYRDTGSLTDAARLTGISRSTAYNLINSADGGAFRAALAEAGKGTDTLLEATAIERAVKGQEEIVYYKGRRVGVRWKYDNRLLMSLLRARNPLKYAPLSEIEGWLARRGIAQPADFEGALDRLHAAEAEWGRRLPGETLPEGPALTAARPAPAIGPPPPALEAPAPFAIAAEAADPARASTSSTLDAEPPAQASTSSTLDAEPPAQASNLSTSAPEPAAQGPGSSSLPAETPAAPEPPVIPAKAGIPGQEVAAFPTRPRPSPG